MANQAFALSPISARASLPGEEDYEAIREAFMETARGRWFLDEYARRNRNSDTRMVLDAVARIEETIAAQKRPPPPVVVDRLPAALTSIRSAVERAQGAAFTAVEGLRLEQNLAPIRKGARIIKEISWRWREIGADGRICDLIDSQVEAIDTACTLLAETDPRVALRAAFEIIRSEIDAFRDGGSAKSVSPPAAPPAAPPPAAEAPLRVMPEVVVPAPASAAMAAVPADEVGAIRDVEAAFSEPELPVETAVAETAPETLSAEETPSGELSQEDADAQDEAVLEMVAMEMAAPDPDEAADLPVMAESEAVHVTTPPTVEPLTPVASIVEPEPERPPVAAQAQRPSLQIAPPAAPEPIVEASLGSTLIASGILRKPNIRANDPLAPIRRMSQAEKIAFFS
jgi:hypothetical protein